MYLTEETEHLKDYHLTNDFFTYNPFGCLLLLENKTIHDINIRAQKLLGYRPEDLINRPLKTILDDKDFRPEAGTDHEYVPIDFMGEVKLIDKDGHIFPVLWSVIQSDQYSIFIFKSNSEPLKRLHALQEAQMLAHLGSWNYDTQRKKFYWSDEIYRIFGQNALSFTPTYENVIRCVHPEDRSFVENIFMKILNGNQDSRELKYRILHGETEQERWVYQKHLNIDNTNTASSNMITGIIQDVTDNEILLKEYAKFYNAVKLAKNPFIITDQKGRITFINQQCEQVYGYDLNELHNKTLWLLNADKAVYLDNGYSETQYETLFYGLKRDLFYPETGCWEGELISKTKTGKTRWVLVFIHTLRDLYGKLHAFVITGVDVTEERQKEEHVRIETYDAIASLAEHRDNDTGKHMKRIGEFCYLISKKMRKPRIYSDNIRIFAPMHDIGKVGISDDILKAPRALTKDEFNIMKTHTTIGYDILKNRSKLEMAAEIAGNHHERYDGTGYPTGISGKSIPLSARICAVADVYDALRSRRPYKDSFSEEKTMNIISEESGKHFDPVLVNLMLENRKELNSIYEKLTD